MAKVCSNIIVHCSDSSWGSAAEIRKWHQEKGWRDIGYHFVIGNGLIRPDLYLPAMDGLVSVGRELDGDPLIEDNEVGAHALGYNQKSIGICMIGKDVFTARQVGRLLLLLHDLRKVFSIENEDILGHYETERANGKTCPNIDMDHVRYLMNHTQGDVKP